MDNHPYTRDPDPSRLYQNLVRFGELNNHKMRQSEVKALKTKFEYPRVSQPDAPILRALLVIEANLWS